MPNVPPPSHNIGIDWIFNWTHSKHLFVHSYLRAQDSYTPPENVQQIVERLQATAACTTGTDATNFSLEDKYKFLSLCETEFNHTVPSSLLHEMNTICKYANRRVCFLVYFHLNTHTPSCIREIHSSCILNYFQMMSWNSTQRQLIHFSQLMSCAHDHCRPIYTLKISILVSIRQRIQCLTVCPHSHKVQRW